MMGDSGGYLDGQLLIAMPSISDPRFDRSVVYICAHSADGAMGIVINQQATNINFLDLLKQLDIVPENNKMEVSSGLSTLNVHLGGPVEAARGFVLHSSDYFVDENTLPIDGSISLTATIDILRAIARGSGPDKALLALGYAGWAPGQLEDEIRSNGWLICPASSELIFNPEIDKKYSQALAKLGVDPSHLVNTVGNA